MSSSEAGVFSQAELEIERDYRKQVRKLYYKRESDFTSLRAYNDYLEEFESLVEQLIDKGTREATQESPKTFGASCMIIIYDLICNF